MKGGYKECNWEICGVFKEGMDGSLRENTNKLTFSAALVAYFVSTLI